VCDSVWVVYAPPEIQLARLMQRRGMKEAEAHQRITAQPPQEQKVAAANIVIRNTGAFEDTWRQVTAAWQKMVPAGVAASAALAPSAPVKTATLPQGDLTVARGRPRDSSNIAALINRVKKDHPITADDIMAEFGDKAFLMLRVGDRLIGVAGWQVENLVARTTEFFIDPSLSIENALKVLIAEVERASSDLQCEASLLFLPEGLAAHQAIWKQLGYEPRKPQSLGVQAWADAAIESAQPHTSLFFKQLRQDRVLRPI
jgi:dephospho-CoA kinase